MRVRLDTEKRVRNRGCPVSSQWPGRDAAEDPRQTLQARYQKPERMRLRTIGAIMFSLLCLTRLPRPRSTLRQTEDYRVAFLVGAKTPLTKRSNKYPALTLRGICRFRASNIFPSSAGHILLFALRWPSPGEMFDCRSRLAWAGKSSFISDWHSENNSPRWKRGHSYAGNSATRMVPCKAHFGGDFLIATPGLYQVIRLIHGRQVPRGSFELIYLPAPELTPDVIAGVEGYPFAMRAVRMRLECRICKDQMSVYAALNRNEA